MWRLCKFLLLLKSHFSENMFTLHLDVCSIPCDAIPCRRIKCSLSLRQSSLWCTCYYRQLFIVETWLHVFILHVSRIRTGETSSLKPVQFQPKAERHCSSSVKAFISHVSLFHCLTVSLFHCVVTKSFYVSCFSDSQQGNGGVLLLQLE